MVLRENIDLHVAIDAIMNRLVVNTYPETSIANKRIEPGELFCKLSRNFICLSKVFEVALAPVDF